MSGIPDATMTPKLTVSTDANKILMTLGNDGFSSDASPEEQISCAAKQLDRSLPVELTVELEDGEWCDSRETIDTLERYLNVVDEHIPCEHWTNLMMLYPMRSVAWKPSSRNQLTDTRFTHLSQLLWRGSRRQMNYSWIPFTPSLLRNLTALVLLTRIALDDVRCLLVYAEQLSHFQVDAIVDVDNVLTAMQAHLSYKERHERRNLNTLIMISGCDIIPLLHVFDFPSLKKIDYDLRYHTTDQLRGLRLPWGGLNDVSFATDFSAEESSWIKNNCMLGAVHNHNYTLVIPGQPRFE